MNNQSETNISMTSMKTGLDNICNNTLYPGLKYSELSENQKIRRILWEAGQRWAHYENSSNNYREWSKELELYNNTIIECQKYLKKRFKNNQK